MSYPTSLPTFAVSHRRRAELVSINVKSHRRLDRGAEQPKTRAESKTTTPHPLDLPPSETGPIFAPILDSKIACSSYAAGPHAGGDWVLRFLETRISPRHFDIATSRHLVISTLLDLNYPPLTLRECDRVLDDVFGAAVVDTGSRCIMDTMGEQFSDCIEHTASTGAGPL